MKLKLIGLAILTALLAVPCFAQIPISSSGMPIPAAAVPQTATTPPSTPVVASCSQINVGTEYIHFSNGMSGTMVEAAHPLTSCAKKYILSIGYAQVMVPAANTSFYLMGPRMDVPLSAFTKSLDPALQSIVFFGGAGLGTAQVVPPNVAQANHFAYGLHGGVAVSPGSIFGASVQLQIEAGLVGYNRTVFRASTLPGTSAQFAAGVMFNIGQKAAPAAPAATVTPTAK